MTTRRESIQERGTYSDHNKEAAYTRFLSQNPGYDADQIDHLRDRQYSRIDQQQQIYLDYTGGGLHASSQLEEHMELLSRTVLGNPHSNNPTSQAMTNLVEGARARVLEYFLASPDEYVAIFTANASGALKHVGESYPFMDGSRYALTYDNHNSVNGIREFARARGARIDYVPLLTPELRVDQASLDRILARARTDRPNLFAFPAQSNFSGVQHPLDLIAVAQEQGWDVLLDAAAFVPSNRLDLSRWKPDFVSVSFYKMFGYPTGVGCLLARKPALERLQRPWFAGGTITLASVQADRHFMATGEAAFEDGTVDYLNIPAVAIGLGHIEKLTIERIHDRVEALTAWILEEFLALRHDNGRHLVRVYGPIDTDRRGGTITVNLYDPQGRLFDYRRIEELANQEQISLRTGCFCNPGAGEASEELTTAEIEAGFAAGPNIGFPYFISVIEHNTGKSAGAIRVSVGIASNFADVYHLLRFISGFVNVESNKIGAVEFDIDSCRVIRDGA